MNGTSITPDPFGVNEEPDGISPSRTVVVGSRLAAHLAQARTLPALLALMRAYASEKAEQARWLAEHGQEAYAELLEVEATAIRVAAEAVANLPDDPEPCGPGRIARWLFRRVA